MTMLRAGTIAVEVRVSLDALVLLEVQNHLELAGAWLTVDQAREIAGRLWDAAAEAEAGSLRRATGEEEGGRCISTR